MVFHNELEEQFHKQAIQLLSEAFYSKFNYVFSKEKDFQKILKLLINKRKVIYFLENNKILGILLYSNNGLKFNMNFKSLVQEFGFLKAMFITLHESRFHKKIDDNESFIYLNKWKLLTISNFLFYNYEKDNVWFFIMN